MNILSETLKNTNPYFKINSFCLGMISLNCTLNEHICTTEGNVVSSINSKKETVIEDIIPRPIPCAECPVFRKSNNKIYS